MGKINASEVAVSLVELVVKGGSIIGAGGEVICNFQNGSPVRFVQ